MRIAMAESELARFDNWRDPSRPEHDRLLRKLRQDVERAEADLAYAERQSCNG
jgi:acyl-CoA reductase-like NAD-dependent aldehyde dehydrogenase